MSRDDSFREYWPDPVEDLRDRFKPRRWPAVVVSGLVSRLPSSRRRLRSAHLKRDWRWFAVALFVLVTLDMLTTMYAAVAVGVAAEANPLIRWTLEHGLLAFTAVNLVAAALTAAGFAGLVRLINSSQPPYDRYLEIVVRLWLGVLLVGGLIVFANNVSVIVLGRSLVG